MKSAPILDIEKGMKEKHDYDIEIASVKEKKSSIYKHFEKYINMGDFSNLVTFTVMVTGLILHHAFPHDKLARYILAFGLFGFAGGITNWLAVKMLFDKVPGLVGSGVIPRQFKQIRISVKNIIMETFFDPEYLETYLKERSVQLLKKLNLSQQIKKMLESPDIDTILTVKLTEISTKPEGAMISMIAPMCGGIPGMIPLIKPMLVSFGTEMGNMLVEDFDPLKYITIDQIREEIDALMSEKILFLTPEMVKNLLEEVIRSHLGWLVVWGNVFGGMIGIICEIAGY